MPQKEDIDKTLKRLSSALTQGDIIAFPTETFYALGARYDHGAAIERLYALKNRPRDKAMPLLIGHKRLLNLIAAEVPPVAEHLMDRFWPGPLTLVLRAKETLLPHITAGTNKVAVRVPGSSFALTLAAALDIPITATSANVSSRPPADSAETVLDYFGDNIDILIDCGRSPGILASTIVDVTGSVPVILRHGTISEKEIIRAGRA